MCPVFNQKVKRNSVKSGYVWWAQENNMNKRLKPNVKINGLPKVWPSHITNAEQVGITNMHWSTVSQLERCRDLCGCLKNGYL